ncbi:unnamed protein product [Oppiella nova]|uniref:JmjC domain-containing protein n=1 Tax=Oppiella nova TaxID=334625 RepID=A0A7R9LQ69_9ACAR|nr:unnamed protein product [Oppiella nova]CAG2165173.1 unnamed protein product [Oppiella nova]
MCNYGGKWSHVNGGTGGRHRTVPIEIGSKYTDEEWSQRLITVNEFIGQYLAPNSRCDTTGAKRTGYLAQHNLFDQIVELMADISVPDYCCVRADEDREDEEVDVDINAWFGPKGTVSPLHFDPKDNLLAQVFGHKYVRIYSSDTPREAIYPNDCRLLCNTSAVDLECVDSERFPAFEGLDDYYECVLREGELLFMPTKCWHFVKSLSTSFSISFWWK